MRRTRVIQVRLSEEEFAAIKAAAGDDLVSEFIRRRCLRPESETDIYVPNEHTVVLPTEAWRAAVRGSSPSRVYGALLKKPKR